MHLQENRSISDAQVFTAECWNAKVTCGWNVSEDLFFKVKSKSLFLFLFILVLLNSAVSCFILFLIVCLSHLPFVFQILCIVSVIGVTCIYQLSIKKQTEKATICYVQYFVEYFLFFMLFFQEVALTVQVSR